MKIVGVVGFVGSGKGTVGEILCNDYGFIVDSYAAPLKDAVAFIFGWDRSLLEGDTPESRTWREYPDLFWTRKFGKAFTPREALQLMGTECGRNVYHKNLWVDALEKRITRDNSDVVITDVRFPNEIEQIVRLGGTVIRVKRGIEPLWFDYAAEWNNVDWNNTIPCQANRQVMPDFPGIHYSEFAWIGHPLLKITIDNDGTPNDLRVQIHKLIGEL